MTSLINKLLDAQERALAICPKVGGFPVLAEVLRQAGIKLNRWVLPSCQSIYKMDGGNLIHQGTQLFSGVQEIPMFNQQALITAIKNDQNGETSFHEFLQAIWNAGVISYEVDFLARTVNYQGINCESYLETYHAVEI